MNIIKKFIKLFICTFISLFFIITLINYNYAIVYNYGEHLEEKDGLYYYYTSNNGLYKARPNTYARINDTFYFVNDRGVVYEKDRFDYKLCENPRLKYLIGKPIVYDSIKNLSNPSYVSSKQYTELGINEVNSKPHESAIYKNYTSDPLYNDVFFIGDSYTYLLELFTKKKFKFAARPGYSINSIKNEILNLIDFKDIKYVVIFIGPNDLMASTDGKTFTNLLVDISCYIVDNGAIPVYTSYFGIPNYMSLVPREEYDARVKFLTKVFNKSLYVDLLDIDAALGREYYDYVHPSEEFYEIAFNRIIEAISIEKRKN